MLRTVLKSPKFKKTYVVFIIKEDDNINKRKIHETFPSLLMIRTPIFLPKPISYFLLPQPTFWHISPLIIYPKYAKNPLPGDEG